MTILILSFLVIPYLALYVGLFIWQKWQMHRLKLTPNCLLTRYPLVFVQPRRVALLPYWKHVPEYLRAHGYQVQIWPARRSWLHKMLSFQSTPVHLILDIEDKPTWQSLQSQNFSSVQSLQMLPRPTEFLLSSSKGWTAEYNYLKWAVQLAEQDYTAGAEWEPSKAK